MKNLGNNYMQRFIMMRVILVGCMTIGFIQTRATARAAVQVQVRPQAQLCFYHHTWGEAFSDVWVLGGMKGTITRTQYLQKIADQASKSDLFPTKQPNASVKDLACAMDGSGTQSSLLFAPKLRELLEQERNKLKSLSRAELEKNDKERVEKYSQTDQSSILVYKRDRSLPKDWTPSWDELRPEMPTISLRYYFRFPRRHAALYLLKMYELARSEQRRKVIDQVHPVPVHVPVAPVQQPAVLTPATHENP